VRVLLLSANTELMNMPVLPLGLGCVARATQEAGHEIKIINLMASQDVLGAIESAITEFKPEAIGISVRNIDDQVMSQPKFLLEPVKSMISQCRKFSEAPIIIGGAGYSIFPESALDYLEADMGIQGEGEVSFPLLLERFQDKSDLTDIPGLFLPKAGPQNSREFVRKLDDCPLPLPGLHLWAPRNIQNDDL
jgi:B12 binding protein